MPDATPVPEVDIAGLASAHAEGAFVLDVRQPDEYEAGHVPGLRFISIEREFSALVHGHRVDMVTPRFLNPRIRHQVLNSAELLYVAA